MRGVLAFWLERRRRQDNSLKIISVERQEKKVKVKPVSVGPLTHCETVWVPKKLAEENNEKLVFLNLLCVSNPKKWRNSESTPVPPLPDV